MGSRGSHLDKTKLGHRWAIMSTDDTRRELSWLQCDAMLASDYGKTYERAQRWYP